MGVKTPSPPKLFEFFLVSQLCLFVQQTFSDPTKTRHFEIKNAKIIWEGDTPSPDLTPVGALVALIFAPTALKRNVTPPEKILVTALVLMPISPICYQWPMHPVTRYNPGCRRFITLKLCYIDVADNSAAAVRQSGRLVVVWCPTVRTADRTGACCVLAIISSIYYAARVMSAAAV